ncbi:unnamed protein product [Fraxinus pennsylvanica]|uniref:Bet v I/Major latex protein domain-containing protein n=1 Tax=Fraxinus pennsylvanica TaxID=56036 RepID=A0AAD1YMP9_9LAMI|nr:unnamed protein product [Fraxinus pennsylvanica]
MYPERFKNVKITGGVDGSVGCVKLWDYFAEGGTLQSIELVADRIDDRERSITYKAQGGSIIGEQGYTQFQFTIAPRVGVVRWTVHYEKGSSSQKNPRDATRFAVQVTEMVDSSLV